MTAGQLANRLGLSAAAITVNDLIGAGGALVVFIGFFLPMISYSYSSANLSLASHGGFYGRLVPVLALFSGAALLIPMARRLGPIWLGLTGIMLGLAVGSRDFAGRGLGYGAGWWFCLLGGIALQYGWTTRLASPRQMT